MSMQVLQQLESKIDQALETIELLRLQVEESEQNNGSLQAENVALKQKLSQWENNLSALLNKLEAVDLADALKTRSVEGCETQEEMA